MSRVAPEAFHAPTFKKLNFFRELARDCIATCQTRRDRTFKRRSSAAGLHMPTTTTMAVSIWRSIIAPGRAALLHNSSPTANHWIRLELVGNHQVAGPSGRKSSRNAIGAWVELRFAGTNRRGLSSAGEAICRQATAGCFSAWAILRRLIGPSYIGRPVSLNSLDRCWGIVAIASKRECLLLAQSDLRGDSPCPRE